jgi:hypothetical protein
VRLVFIDHRQNPCYASQLSGALPNELDLEWSG